MKRRVYFVLPDAATAHAVERDLLLARVDDRHMHFMAKDESGLRDLPIADFTQRTDLIPGMEHGLIAGGVTGALAGGIAWALQFSMNIGLGIVLILALLGAVLGVWFAGMIGIGIPNSRLKRFERTLDEGHVLLMVDVNKTRVDEINEIVRAHFKDAQAFGEEPTIPAFP